MDGQGEALTPVAPITIASSTVASDTVTTSVVTATITSGSEALDNATTLVVPVTNTSSVEAVETSEIPVSPATTASITEVANDSATTVTNSGEATDTSPIPVAQVTTTTSTEIPETAEAPPALITIANSTETPNAAEIPELDCKFLGRLPVEVRMMIYKCALTDDLTGSIAPFYRVPYQFPETKEDWEAEYGSVESDQDDASTDSSSTAAQSIEGDYNDDAYTDVGTYTEGPKDSESTAGSGASSNEAVAGDDYDEMLLVRMRRPVLSLSPAILRTCRKIYNEALPVLYDSQTFVFALINNNNRGRSPIFRAQDDKWRFPNLYSADVATAFRRVKHWRVILAPGVYTTEKPLVPPSLVDFCWALRTSEVQTIEICIIRQAAALAKPEMQRQHAGLSKVLQPFDLVRNLESLHFIDANWNFKIHLDLPDYLPTHTVWPGPALYLRRCSIVGSEMMMRLEASARGSNPIMYLFTPLKALVAYGSAFESNERRKLQQFRVFQRFLVMPYPEARQFLAQTKRNIDLKRAGPVDIFMPNAYAGALVNDTQAFRNARLAILENLRTLYEKMEETCQKMSWYGHMLKRLAWEGKLDDISHRDLCRLTRKYLHQWATDFEQPNTDPCSFDDPFTRDLPRGMGPVASRRRRRLFAKMKGMERSFKGTKRCKRYMHLVRKVLVQLREQYLEARRTREVLYQGDRVKDLDAIDLNLKPIGEPFDWDIQRPPVDPGDLPKPEGEDMVTAQKEMYEALCALLPAGSNNN